MEFTKEQIETAGELYSIWNKGIGIPDSETFSEFLDSLLKPETKKIIVEIESEEQDLTPERILSRLKIYSFHNLKVTELPEVFTREDIYEMFQYCIHKNTINTCLNKFSERKSK